MRPTVLIREVRDFPATAFFCLSWVLVFGVMLSLRYQQEPSISLGRILLSGMGDGERLGDLTLLSLARGEYWRLITCNFVHYSVIHIGLNLFAFYMLGTLLESWYGSWTLVAIYGVTGVGGNLVSALARLRLGANPMIHSGGGSVVIMGLIGLLATAGWLSRSTRDRELTWQMLKALAITGALGLIFPRFIDNWGHAGGAIVGLPIGLLHLQMLSARGRPRAFTVGVAWLTVILVGGGAQACFDWSQRGTRRLVNAARETDADLAAYRALQNTRRWLVLGGDPTIVQRSLGSQANRLDYGPTRSPYRRLVRMSSESMRRKLRAEERQAVRRDLETIRQTVRERLERHLKTYWDLRRQIALPSRSPQLSRSLKLPVTPAPTFKPDPFRIPFPPGRT